LRSFFRNERRRIFLGLNGYYLFTCGYHDNYMTKGSIQTPVTMVLYDNDTIYYYYVIMCLKKVWPFTIDRHHDKDDD